MAAAAEAALASFDFGDWWCSELKGANKRRTATM
jgi:hypothetical protein